MAKWGKLKDKLKCNQPKRDKQGSKNKVVKACKDGKEKIVRFGHSMPDGTSDPDRRKSYCARSGGIKGKNDKFSANYWSRKAWKC
jgi:hypothetical protein